MGRKPSYTEDALVKAVRESKSVADVIRYLGFDVSGGRYYAIHKLVKKLKLDTSHWVGQGHLRGKSHSWTKKKPLSEFLKDGIKCNRVNVKNRLIKEGFLKNKCSVCNIDPVWNTKPLVLVLDHINGKNNDYRISNLRLLCPNCDSQSSTFKGRNSGLRKRPKDTDKLREEILTLGINGVARKYNASRSAVQNWRRNLPA